MSKCYLSIILLLFSLESFCQQIHVRGRVESQDQGIDGVSILNIRSKVSISSNIRGEFAMDVIKGDSVYLEKNGFCSAFLVVVSGEFLKIWLKPTSTTLKDVNIWSMRSSPAKNYENARREYKQIFQKGDMSNIVTISPVDIGLNIAPLYSALSKEGNDARRLQKIIRESYESSEIDSRYNATLVDLITGLKGDDLQKFTKKYRPELKWILKASDYEIQLYIKDKFKLYLDSEQPMKLRE